MLQLSKIVMIWKVFNWHTCQFELWARRCYSASMVGAKIQPGFRRGVQSHLTGRHSCCGYGLALGLINGPYSCCGCGVLLVRTFPPPLLTLLPSNDDQFYHDGQHSHTLVLMIMPVTRRRSDISFFAALCIAHSLKFNANFLEAALLVNFHDQRR